MAGPRYAEYAELGLLTGQAAGAHGSPHGGEAAGADAAAPAQGGAAPSRAYTWARSAVLLSAAGVALAVVEALAAPRGASWTHGAPASDAIVMSAAGKCKTASEGEECFDKVHWAVTQGIHSHPEYYPGLSKGSSFTEFQALFHKKNYGKCGQPCPGPGPVLDAPAAAPASGRDLQQGACLCLFDVDRTLTGKQAAAANCPSNRLMQGVPDSAYGGGDLVLSELGLGVKDTFCGMCHMGVVSMGTATGPGEQSVIQAQLIGTGSAWHMWNGKIEDIHTPLVIGCPDGVKAQCARGIVNYFRNELNVQFPDSEVYFFDDHDGNTNGFAAQGFNARQVSCESRDGIVGLCGAKMSEIVRAKGVQNCW